MGLQSIEDKYDKILEELMSDMEKQGISGWSFTHLNGFSFSIRKLAKSTRKKYKVGEFAK